VTPARHVRLAHPPRHLGLVVAMGAAFAPVVYFLALKDYQRERVRTFLHGSSGG